MYFGYIGFELGSFFLSKLDAKELYAHVIL